MSVWRVIAESEQRELNKISRTIKSLFSDFFTGVCGQQDLSSLVRQRRKLSRFILCLNVYETTQIRIYEVPLKPPVGQSWKCFGVN